MELIELKSTWALLQRDVISNDRIDDGKLLRTIHGQSKSEISRIKSGLQFKFIIASLAIITAIALAITSYTVSSINPLDFIFSPMESTTFFCVMALTIGIIIYFNYQAYSQIRFIQGSSLNLKDNLKSFIDAMQKAIAFNIYSDTFIAPIIFTWVYYAYAFNGHELAVDLRTAFLFILPILIGLLSYFIQRFMQRLKFGQYLDRLNSYLDSLEKNSSEL